MKKGLRRVAAVAVATLVVAPALATVASATSTFTFDRTLQGQTRYDTAVAVAAKFGNSTNVILANGGKTHTVDALTAAYLAGFAKAPVLLTTLDTTPPAVKDRIVASGAKDIWIIGGIGAISAAQETALGSLGTVHRLGGQDRYLTAQKVIDQVGVAKSTTAIVTTGVNFPDALGAGPLSYVKGMPIGITKTSTLPASTLKSLQDAGVKTAIVLGGPTVVSQSVVDALTAGGITPFAGAGVTAGRIFGSTRAETSSMLADYMIAHQDFSNTAVNVASGQASLDGADALGGASLSGQGNRPTLITYSTSTPGAGVLDFLKAHAPTLTTGYIFGGTGAVSAANAALMTAAAQTVTSNQTYTVTPGASATVPASTTALPNQGARTFTVSGLDASKSYNLALLNAADVLTDANNQVTFADADQNNLADGTDGSSPPTSAKFDVVNGVSASGTEVNGVSPTSGGSISFTVNSLGYDDVIPVFWLDDTSDNSFTAKALDLKAPATANADPKAPVESFGLGGETVWSPNEAANGSTITAAKVISVSADSAVIKDNVLGYETVNFKSGDVFKYDSNTASMATFLKALSAGDTITGTYSVNFQSTFNLTVDVPGTPSGVAVAVGNFDNTAASAYDAKVTWTAPNPADGLIATYHVTVYTVDSTGKVTTTVQDSANTTGTETNARVDNLPNGNYAATVYAVSQTGDNGAETAAVKFTVQKGNVDTIKPTLNSTTLANGAAATAANIDSTDTITLQFSEGVQVAGTSALRFTDPDGEIFQITNGTGSTWTVGNYTPTGGTAIANGQITILLSADPVKVGGVTSTNAGAQVPGTITVFSSTVTDLSGNTVDLANSSDKVIDTPLG